MLTTSRFRVKSKSENLGKLQGRKRITSKEGTYDFFSTMAKYCPRSTKCVRWWNFWRRVSGQLTPQVGHCPKNSNRHNSGPEVDIDKRSTAFFIVRRPLADSVKICRQRAPQVGDLEKVPRPQNFQNSKHPNFHRTTYVQILHESRGHTLYRLKR